MTKVTTLPNFYKAFQERRVTELAHAPREAEKGEIPNSVSEASAGLTPKQKALQQRAPTDAPTTTHGCHTRQYTEMSHTYHTYTDVTHMPAHRQARMSHTPAHGHMDVTHM